MNLYFKRIGAFLQYFGSTLVVAIMQVCINPMMAKNLSPEDYATIWTYTKGKTEPRFSLYEYPEFDFRITDKMSNLEIG